VRRLLLIAVTSRVLVLAAGYLAVVIIGYTLIPPQFRLSHNEFWNLPARFDAGWYLGIARRGYEWNPLLVDRQQNIAFFPLFPMAMRVAVEFVTLPAHILKDPDLFGGGNARFLWAGTLVSIAAFCGALVTLPRLHAAEAISVWRGGLLLAASPFAFFFSAAYSEGLFLLFAVLTFAAYARERWGAVFCFGLAAGLCRSNGWALSVGLLAAVAVERRAIAQTLRAAIAACGPAAGTVCFSAYIWNLTGYPLAWAFAQRAWGRHTDDALAFLSHRVASIQTLGVTGYVRADPVDVFTVCCVVGMCALAVLAIRDGDIKGGVFTLAYLVPGMVINIPSLGRMTCVLFPAYLALGRRLTSRQAVIVAILFGVAQAVLATRFFTWRAPT
jgi:hypothetical protein